MLLLLREVDLTVVLSKQQQIKVKVLGQLFRGNFLALWHFTLQRIAAT